MKSNAIKMMILLLATALLCFGTTLTVSAEEGGVEAAVEAVDNAVEEGAEAVEEATEEAVEEGAEAVEEATEEAPAAE